MQVSDSATLIASLSAAAKRLVVVATGGGSRAISALVTTPGASDAVLEGLVPYAREAVDRLLGGRQESYCSSRTARRLAIAAWQRGVGYGTAPEHMIGAAVVASLRSVAPKRGPHRIIVAVQTLDATTTASVELEKGPRTRTEEEDLAASLLLDRIGATVRASGADASHPSLRAGEAVTISRSESQPAWQRLLTGDSRALWIAPGGNTAADAGPSMSDRLILPGSFDPLHDGHRTMARIAEEIAERPVDYELSIANVDKPLLDYQEIATRVAQFADKPLWLTRAATFLEKVALFPGSTFVLGADTYVRLADPRYYGGSVAAATAAAQGIAEKARGLIVFGRVNDGAFIDPATLDVPRPLRDISYFVSQREFRIDVSSTDLRRKQSTPGPM